MAQPREWPFHSATGHDSGIDSNGDSGWRIQPVQSAVDKGNSCRVRVGCRRASAELPLSANCGQCPAPRCRRSSVAYSQTVVVRALNVRILSSADPVIHHQSFPTSTSERCCQPSKKSFDRGSLTALVCIDSWHATTLDLDSVAGVSSGMC